MSDIPNREARGSQPFLAGATAPARFASADNPSIDNDEASLATLLKGAAIWACSVAEADGAALALRDPMGIVCRATSGVAPELGSRLQSDSGFTWECLSTGRTLVCDDAENDPRIGRSAARALCLHSLVAVPLRSPVQGRVVGVLEVFSSQPSAFGSSQIAELQRIADSVASSLPPELSRDLSISATAGETARMPAPLPEEQAAAGLLRIVSPGERVVDHTPKDPAQTENQADTPAQEQTRWPWLALAIIILLCLPFLYFFSARRALRQSSQIAVNATVKPQTQNTNLPAPVKNSASNSTTPKSQLAPPPTHSADETELPASAPISAQQSKNSSPPPPTSEDNNLRTPPIVLKAPAQSATPATQTKILPPELALAPAPAGGPDLLLKTTIPAPPGPRAPPNFTAQHTFRGHSSWVTAVAFSADGQQLASASWDRSVKLWAVASGKELSTLTRKMTEVQTLAFSRDGRWIATENSSNAVTLWDARTGQQVITLPVNKPLGIVGKNWVYSIAFSPDSRWLASGLDDRTIRVWDVETGLPVCDLTGEQRSVMYVAFSPDGRLLASGGDDRTIKIWDLATRQPVLTLSGHKKNIYAVAFSPNGRWLASASADKTVRLWDVASGREIHTLAGHVNSVTSVAFSRDSHWLASGSWDKTVKIWNVETGQEVQTLAGDRPVYAVAFDPRGGWLAAGSQDGTIRLWRSGLPRD